MKLFILFITILLGSFSAQAQIINPSSSGGVSIGSSYQSIAAPTNGEIIQGKVGIGTATPLSTLHVQGGGITVGIPTGGDEGAGTINVASNFYVNGVAVSGGGGSVTTTGTPASGNLTKFSGASSITNGDLAGDITTSGTLTTTLATVNSNVGSFGSSTSIPSFTVNGKGLITAASGNVVIAPAGTLSGATLNSGVTASSLTSVGTLTSLTMGGDITLSAHNLVTDTTTGTKIGTLSTQKLGFFNATPIVQPTGDACTALQNLGLVASCTSSGGAVSSVSNADGTLTISPTTGAVVASIALGHVNAWTAAQSIQSTSATALAVGANGTTNPVLTIDASTASQVSGVAIKGAATGSATTITATDSGTNAPLSLLSKGNGTLTLQSPTGPVNINNNGATHIQITSAGLLSFSTPASGTASSTRFLYTGASDLTLTTLTEAPEVVYDLSQTRQHSTGAIALQRDFLIKGSDHSFVGASTLTDDAVFSVALNTGASTNATITNYSAIYVPTAVLTGTKTNSFGLNIAAASGATNNYAGVFTGGNVGIGTAVPTQPLDVLGSSIIAKSFSGYAQATVAGGAGAVNTALIGIDASNAYMGAIANLPLQIQTNNVQRIHVNATGEVGIGTNSALSTLHVRPGVDQDYRFFGKVNLADGAYMDSSNDAGSTFKNLEIESSLLGLNATSGAAVIIGTTSATSNARLTVVGHIGYFQSAVPVITSCGSGSANAGSTDNKGQIASITAATACTLTFGSTMPTAPACVASDSAGTAVGVSSISTSAVTFSMAALTGTLYYICQ